MKKTVSAILAVLLVLSCVMAFASCSGSNTETTTADNNTTADGTTAEETTVAPIADVDYIKGKGKLVVGVTVFEPMDYQLDDGTWTGFDAEYANAVGEKLGVTVEFVKIDWGNKVFELDSKAIDCVWNGMTINDDLKAAMSITDPYVKNAQVVVMSADKAADYTTVESLKGLKFAVEAGSAGKDVAEENSFTYTAVETQADALMEVSSGSSDACIIDLTMAESMTGTGTSYANLKQAMSLNEEEYGVGCRLGSDLCTEINSITKDLVADGTLTALAAKYSLTLVG